MLVAQFCLTLCSPMDSSLLGSSVHGILQARILEWVEDPPSGDLPNPGIEPTSSMSLALAGGFLTISTTWEAPQIRNASRICVSSLCGDHANLLCISLILVSELPKQAHDLGQLIYLTCFLVTKMVKIIVPTS